MLFNIKSNIIKNKTNKKYIIKIIRVKIIPKYIKGKKNILHYITIPKIGKIRRIKNVK